MRVEFEWTIDREQNLKRICRLLGLKCRKDKKYTQHFFGCDAPNTGYVIDVEDSKKKKKRRSNFTRHKSNKLLQRMAYTRTNN